LTASESSRFGYYTNSQTAWSTNISGDAAYLSNSEAHPLSVVYTGGYMHSTSNEPSSVFQSLDIAQNLNTRQWSFAVSDLVSYLPESPLSTGLSGIPGLGDLGITAPPTIPDTGQEIFSRYGQRVSNTTTGSASRKLTGATSLQATGDYSLQRFVGQTDSLDTNQASGGLNLSHRIDALNTVSGGYSYSNFTYPSQNFTLVSQSLTITYDRQWTRLIRSEVLLGPQRTTSGAVLPGGGGSTINLQANASVYYAGERTTYSAVYSRGVRGGSGVLPGTINDSLIVEGNRKLGQLSSIGFSGGYARNQTLQILTPDPTSIQSITGQAQFSETITQFFTGYISYSAQEQAITGAGNTFNGFNGLSQTIAAGITYSPRAIHIGH
jgi:hypothetical protein